MKGKIKSKEKILRGKVHQFPGIDETLTIAGKAADAKTTGEKFAQLLQNDTLIAENHNELVQRVDRIGAQLNEVGRLYFTVNANDNPADRWLGTWMLIETKTDWIAGMDVYIWMCIAPINADQME